MRTSPVSHAGDSPRSHMTPSHVTGAHWHLLSTVNTAESPETEGLVQLIRHQISEGVSSEARLHRGRFMTMWRGFGLRVWRNHEGVSSADGVTGSSERLVTACLVLLNQSSLYRYIFEPCLYCISRIRSVFLWRFYFGMSGAVALSRRTEHTKENVPSRLMLIFKEREDTVN